NSAVEAGNKEEATEAFKVANKQIHKFVSKGVLKRETASRKVSRLNKAVNAI
ncbi:MAG: 30S ribosomal protein S20, partial [Thiovulaceae bacterium]|nr:30S ribosomal protein S20 [Sulfurimonadaceae bacterium]